MFCLVYLRYFLAFFLAQILTFGAPEIFEILFMRVRFILNYFGIFKIIFFRFLKIFLKILAAFLRSVSFKKILFTCILIFLEKIFGVGLFFYFTKKKEVSHSTFETKQFLKKREELSKFSSSAFLLKKKRN